MPNPSLSILGGGIVASGWNNVRGDTISRMYFEALSKKYHFSLDAPIRDLPEEARKVILYGTGGEKLTLHYDQQRGKGTLYQPFEGVVGQPRAPLPRNAEPCHARGDRAVHGGNALPGLRRRAVSRRKCSPSPSAE